MRKSFRLLAHALKAALIVAVGAIGRISRAEGKGVIEEQIQNAIYQVAQYYVRSVSEA